MVVDNRLYSALFGKSDMDGGSVIDFSEHGRVGGLSTGQGFKHNSIIDKDSGSYMSVNADGSLNVVPNGSEVDANNSTTTPLLADATFTGTATEILHFAAITILIHTDVVSADNGLVIQFSPDGTDWHDGEAYTIPANSTKFFTPPVQGRYYRVVYTNGGSDQTTLHIHTVLKKSPVKWSSHNIQDNLNDADDGELNLSVLKLRTAQDNYVSGAATNSGNFKVSIEEFDSALNTSPLPVKTTSTSVDSQYEIAQAINEIYSTYGDTVSVENKKKSLLKFGARTTVGTTWETVMNAQGALTEEVLLSTNGITTVVSSSASDTQPIVYEYHTISGGNLTFGVGTVTLNGTTPVTLPVACARANRAYNNDSSALVGNIYFYEGGTRTDANTHLMIPAGAQQTQKAATAISQYDYWIISNVSINVLSKVTKYAEARLEVRQVGKSYWRPLTQTFSATDSTGTINYHFEPYRIVPQNYDVRLAVRTNTSGVDVSGGFSGFLAN